MNSISILTGRIKKFICVFSIILCAFFADAQPVLDWYKQTASGSSESSREIVVDKFNNVYVLGEISGMVDFDDGPGMFTYQSTFSREVFVCKYNPSGNLIWIKTFNVNGNYAMHIDDSSDVFISGTFSGIVDFDPDSSNFILNSAGGYAMYLFKLDSAGLFVWAKQINLGGSITMPLSLFKIKGDFQGGLYVGTRFNNIPTFAKFDNDGNIIWIQQFGNNTCQINTLDIDNNSNILLGGSFGSVVDFNPDTGITLLNSSNGRIFLTKWNPLGQLIWAKNFGGNNLVVSMVITNSNQVVVTGDLNYLGDFDPGVDTTMLTPTSNSLSPFFVQLDSLGNLVWANIIERNVLCTAMCIDSIDNILITGYCYGMVDFDPDTNVVNVTNAGNGKTFVCKFDSAFNFDNVVVFGNRFGYAINTGLNRDVYVTGNYDEVADMDPSTGIANLHTDMESSIFINKLDSSFNFQWAQSIVGSEIYVLGSHSDDNGNSYSSGVFYGTVDFDPDSSLNLHESIDTDKIFIRKLNSTGDMAWLKIVEGEFNKNYQFVKTDNNGNIFFLGIMSATSDMDPGPGIYNLDLPLNSTNAHFILKLDSSGNFVWAKAISNIPIYPSDTVNYISDMVVDGAGSIILLGTFRAFLDADPGTGTYSITSPDYDVYILKLNSSGIFEWVKQIGNPNDYEESNSLKLDGFGNIYLSGLFNAEVDFDPGPSIFHENPNDGFPSFILKLNPHGEFIWVRQISFHDGYGSVTHTPELEVSEDGTWYATALFEGCLDFDPGIGIDTAWAVTNGENYYISKWSSNGSLIWKVITPQAFYSPTNRSVSICEDYSNNVFWSTPYVNSTIFYFLNDSGLTTSGSGHGASGFVIDGVDQHNNLYTYSTIPQSLDLDFTGAVQTVTLSGTSDVVIAKYNTGNPACSVSPTGIASNVVDNTLCLGQDVVLTRLGGILSAGGSFNWFADSCGGTFIGNGPSIVVSPTDTTTYFLRTEDSCGVSNCLSITLFIDTPPSPPTITGNGLFCSGDSIYLDAGPGFAGYVWSTGSLVQTTPITSNGQYNVTVSDANGCTSTSSINAVTYPDPPLTVIPTSHVEICLGDTVQFIANLDPGYSYQWLVNSYPITGANNYYYDAFSNGRYSCMVTDLNMCDSVSSSIRVAIVCMPPMENEMKFGNENVDEEPQFYVNYDGANDKVIIHGEKLKGLNYLVQLIDISGRVIFSSTGTVENFKMDKLLNCSSLANSLYFVTIKTEEEYLNTKFVKN